MRPRRPHPTALALLAGACLAAAGGLLAGPAPTARAFVPPPVPCPRAGPEIWQDLALPQWSFSLVAVFEGTVTGRRGRTAAEVASDPPDSWAGVSVWAVAVDHVLSGRLTEPVEVWSPEQVRTAGLGRTVPLAVGGRYQLTAMWLPAPSVDAAVDPARVRLVAQCANRWPPPSGGPRAGPAPGATRIALAFLATVGVLGVCLIAAGTSLRVRELALEERERVAVRQEPPGGL